MMLKLANSPARFEDRSASGALTKTGGYLSSFSHTLQPYIGCRFGCEYCYVKGLGVHRFHTPVAEWGEYVHPRVGIDDRLRRELANHKRRGGLAQLRIFMSSVTDPYQAIELRKRLSRRCLLAFQEYRPDLLVVQTRSPFVAEDFDLILGLEDGCWLNVTLETDLDDVRRMATPRCPSVNSRLDLLQRAQAAGLQVQVTVSPCLPFSDVETFGRLLLAHGKRIVVDTFASGDGQSGKRTARTGTPALFEREGWGEWRSEAQARALYSWLQHEIGERAGWSQQGFSALAASRTRAMDGAVMRG